MHTRFERCRTPLIATAVALVATYGCATGGGPARDSQPAGPGNPPDGTTVVVSRRAVTITFPRDTAHAWGWGAGGDIYASPYGWSIFVDETGVPRSIGLRVDRDSAAALFRSLGELVGVGKADVCRPGMVAYCDPTTVRASARHGRVVLEIRDSAAIADLFGLKPRWVEVSTWREGAPLLYRADSVRVTYAEPAVPEPDSALHARAALARGAWERAIHRRTRFIAGAYGGGGAAWLQRGDSASLSVEETECVHDACRGGWEAFPYAAWSVRDSTVVSLHGAPDSTARRIPRTRSVTVIARALGRTTIRVSDLHGSGDTASVAEPSATEITLDVVVTRPVGAVRICPRPETVPADTDVVFRLAVLDRAGTVIPHAPVTLRVEGGPYPWGTGAADSAVIRFSAPGSYTVTASFPGHADTLQVRAVPADTPASSPNLPAGPVSPCAPPGRHPGA